MLEDSPPSLLPLSVDGSGQSVLSPESTSSPTVQVLINEDCKEVVLEGQNMGSLAANGDGILHTSVSPRLIISSSVF